jgi:hypothetical protein
LWFALFANNQVEEVEMGGACSTYGGEEKHFISYWWENQRPLGRPRSRWVDNIRMDLGEVG